MRTGADNTCVWTITPWGNTAPDAYYLTNAGSGPSYKLDEQPNGSWLFMNSNTTVYRPGQQWTFMGGEAINNNSFSTVSDTFLQTFTVLSLYFEP